MANENEQLAQEFEQLRYAAQNAGQGLDDASEKTKKLSDAAKQGAEQLTRGFGNFVKTVGEGNTDLKTFNGMIDAAAGAASNLAEVLPIAGKAISAGIKAAAEAGKFVVNQLETTSKTFGEISEVGAATARGMTGLQQQFIASGMSLQGFKKTIVENANTLARWGGTVGTSADSFAKAVGDITKSKAGDELRRMGFSADQIGEAAAGFLKQQTILGRQNKVTQDSLASSSIAYAKEIDQLSKLTGASRKEIEKQQQAAMEEGKFLASLRDMEDLGPAGAEAAKQIRMFQGQISQVAPEVGKGIRDLTSGIANSPEARKLINSTGGAAQGIVDRLRRGEIDAITAQKQLGQAAQANEKSQRQYAKAVGDNQTAFNKYSELVRVATLGEQDSTKIRKDLDAAGKSAAEGQDELTNQTIQAQKGLEALNREVSMLGFTMMPKAAEAITAVSNATTQFVNSINDLLAGKVPESSLALDGLTVAAGLAAAAMTAMAAKSVLGGVADVAGKGAAGKGAALLKGAKLAGAGLGLGVVGLGADYAAKKAEESGNIKTAGGLGVAGAAAKGAGMGMMFGPWGAAVGGALGAGYGLYQNWDKLTGKTKAPEKSATADESKKIEELTKQEVQVKVNKLKFAETDRKNFEDYTKRINDLLSTDLAKISADKNLSASDRKKQIEKAREQAEKQAAIEFANQVKAAGAGEVIVKKLKEQQAEVEKATDARKKETEAVILQQKEIWSNLDFMRGNAEEYKKYQARRQELISQELEAIEKNVTMTVAEKAAARRQAQASATYKARTEFRSQAQAAGAISMTTPTAATTAPGAKDNSGLTKTGTGSTEVPKGPAAGGNMSEDAIKKMIVQHEGIRYTPYRDSLGLWTVGVGHLIGDGRTLPDSWNRKFSHEEVMTMFEKDYDHHRAAAERIPGFTKFGSAGQGALTDLTFNMGPNWINKFPNTAKQIAAGNAQGAAAGLEDSKWYTQVGNRAPTIVNLLRNSVPAKDGGILDAKPGGHLVQAAEAGLNEAFVPLPNGKNIPVEMPSLIESQQQQNQLLTMLLDSMAELVDVSKTSTRINKDILRVSRN